VWHKKKDPEPVPEPIIVEDYLKTLKEERIKKGVTLVDTMHNWEKDLR